MKTARFFIPLFACVVILMTGPYGCRQKKTEDVHTQGSITPEERLKWFKEAKFGMFIHWGPYSRIAGEWNGKTVKPGGNAEWAMKFLQIPREEYRQMARKFDPVHFDARYWVQLAKNAGMKYLVITAKHHDGFAMYHSQVSEYNIVDWTPFDRDPLRELSEACQEAGIRFCVYYSHREDWDEPYGYGNDWDFDFDPESNLDAFEHNYVDTKAKPQVSELLTEYGPIGLVWFDRGMYTPQQGREFAELVHNLQPMCLVNGRVGHYDQELLGDYQSMSDNGMPIGGIEEYWETPQTMNTTWGYSKFDHNWKSVEEIVQRLVRIVGTGGNYLLNIGPDGMGDIPEPSVGILKGVGRWMDKYSESIYATIPSPFEPQPWGFTTSKEQQLFLHVFDPPKDGKLVLGGLLTPVSRVYPLAQTDQKLHFTQPGNTLSVAWTNAIEEDPVCTVIKVELQDTLKAALPVVTQSADSLELDYLQAITAGDVMKRYNRKGRFHISKFLDPDDKVLWNVDIRTPGTYDVDLLSAVLPAWAGRSFCVSNGQDTLHLVTEGTGGWYDYKRQPIGRLSFPGPGTYQVSLFPADNSENFLMYLQSIDMNKRE